MANAPTRNLSSTAERLRTVKKAHERFLAVWALECIWDQARALDHAAEDLKKFQANLSSHSSPAGPNRG